MYDLISLALSVATLACLVGGLLFQRRQKSVSRGTFPDVAILVGLSIAISGAITFGVGNSIGAVGLLSGAFLTGLGTGALWQRP